MGKHLHHLVCYGVWWGLPTCSWAVSVGLSLFAFSFSALCVSTALSIVCTCINSVEVGFKWLLSTWYCIENCSHPHCLIITILCSCIRGRVSTIYSQAEVGRLLIYSRQKLWYLLNSSALIYQILFVTWKKILQSVVTVLIQILSNYHLWIL